MASRSCSQSACFRAISAACTAFRSITTRETRSASICASAPPSPPSDAIHTACSRSDARVACSESSGPIVATSACSSRLYTRDASLHSRVTHPMPAPPASRSGTARGAQCSRPETEPRAGACVPSRMALSARAAAARSVSWPRKSKRPTEPPALEAAARASNFSLPSGPAACTADHWHPSTALSRWSSSVGGRASASVADSDSSMARASSPASGEPCGATAAGPATRVTPVVGRRGTVVVAARMLGRDG
mmetsp:Transcript_8863/g.29301  ORF Transcript_8863/g.29301 Transcript_8863/m.29301 type:complete len:249 (+) Transcript_8863:350-1096(+)